MRVVVEEHNGLQVAPRLSSLAFVVAYFGRLPNYFPLFLHTAAANPTIEFKFFGDVTPDGLTVPPNVTFTAMTLANIADRAERVFGFRPTLPGAYKLCDYKPIYGEIFAAELSGFDYWGHCDIDMLLGNLRAYLDENLLRKYLRIFMTGHLSVYRNTEAGNGVFRLTAAGVDYREVFRDPRNRYFDEWRGMYRLHLEHQIPYFHDGELFADTWSDVADLRVGEGARAQMPQLFLWEKGEVRQLFAEGDRVESRPYMYIHLQKRSMKLEQLSELYAAPRWYLTGDRIIPGSLEPLTRADLISLNPRRPFVDRMKQLGRPLKRLRRWTRDTLLLRRHAGL